MPSKIVVDKQKSTREMLSIVKAGVDGLAAEIATRLSKENNGDEKSIQDAAKLLVQLPCNRVEKNCVAMIKADDEYIREEADDDEPRRNRDNTLATLSSAIVELRALLGVAYGTESLRGFGFSGRTPQDPEQLVRFSKEVSKTILDKQKDGTFPAPKPGITVDLSAHLTTIEKNTSLLDGYLQKVTDERKELQVALAKKNSTMDVYDSSFQETTNLLESLFRFAGQDEIADKLRPSTHYPGTLEDPTDPTASE